MAWCESFEKNFDSTLKALNKFKDDIKSKPEFLPGTTEKRCTLYLELLQAELEEINQNFKLSNQEDSN